jgi:LacI family transcriptional regulator
MASDEGRSNRKRKKPTMRDVAERAGVSIFTVSRVVNDSGFVRDATRKKVEEAIDVLGYVPSAVARRLRSGKFHAIGLLISDISNPFWNQVLVSAQAFFSDQELGVVLGNSRADAKEERRQLKILLAQGVDGVIATPLTQDSNVVAELERRHVPCVVLDRKGDFDVDAVRVDRFSGTAQITKLFLELGHRRIALITGRRAFINPLEIYEGYAHTLHQAGLPVEEALVAWRPYTVHEGAITTEQLMALPNPPTAIIAGNNAVAAGVLEALGEAELRVPADVAVASLGGTTPALYSFLTSATSPASELSLAASEMLYERMKGYDGPSREKVFAQDIRIRTSSGPTLTP